MTSWVKNVGKKLQRSHNYRLAHWFKPSLVMAGDSCTVGTYDQRLHSASVKSQAISVLIMLLGQWFVLLLAAAALMLISISVLQSYCPATPLLLTKMGMMPLWRSICQHWIQCRNKFYPSLRTGGKRIRLRSNLASWWKAVRLVPHDIVTKK